MTIRQLADKVLHEKSPCYYQFRPQKKERVHEKKKKKKKKKKKRKRVKEKEENGVFMCFGVLLVVLES